jgi:hypothetical protein
MVFELNARPGLGIQVAIKQFKIEIERVKGLNVKI